MTELIDYATILLYVTFLQSTLVTIYAADDTLDCFSCSNLTNINDCHTTKICSPSQSCFTESYMVNGLEMFTLGCKEKLFCDGIDQTHQFGRRESGCTQCCSLHGCNKYLCPLRFTAAPPQVDGKWSEWGGWGDCSSSCGIGLQSRYRNCDNPPPSANGRLCLGDAKDVGLCNVDCSNTASTSTTTSTTTTTTVITTHYNDPMTSGVNYVTNGQTQAPGDCKDLIDCSGYYRPEACHGIYSPWAHRFCPMHCGFCPSATQAPCINTIPNCHEYQNDVCTKQGFWQWREAHCRKFCNLC